MWMGLTFPRNLRVWLNRQWHIKCSWNIMVGQHITLIGERGGKTNQSTMLLKICQNRIVLWIVLLELDEANLHNVLGMQEWHDKRCANVIEVLELIKVNLFCAMTAEEDEDRGLSWRCGYEHWCWLENGGCMKICWEDDWNYGLTRWVGGSL